ncbi:MAG: EAL domain-containing protein [Sedimenticola sp.]
MKIITNEFLKNSLNSHDDLFNSSYHFFRSAYMDAPIAIKYYDLDGNIVMANKSAFDLFGVESGGDLKGFNLFEDPILDNATKQRIREGKPLRHDIEFSFDTVRKCDLYPTSKTGIINLDASVIPFISQAGDHVGYLLFLIDITAQKAHEKSLELALEQHASKLKEANTALRIEITEREQAEQALIHQLNDQEIIASILNLSLQSFSLKEKLAKSLEIILQKQSFGFDTKGIIFLVNSEGNELSMKARQGISDAIKEDCARVPFGQCLCGQTAQSGETIYADHVDYRHDHIYTGIEPHGHYCIPIKFDDQLLGVLTLYLKVGHTRNVNEEHFISSVSDVLAGIIHRSKAEEEMRRFEHIVSNASDLLALLDRNFTYLAANEAYLKAFSKSREDVIGHSAPEIFGEVPFETTIRPHAERCFSGQNVNYHEWLDFPGLGKRFMDVSYSPFYGLNSEVIGFVVNARDITQRKLAEEQLRLSAAVFENTSEGVVITDHKSNIISINQAVTEITGYSESEIIGKNPRLWKSDRHDQAFYQSMWASLEQTGRWRSEIWNRRKNGEAFPCLQTITRVKSDADDTFHYVSVISDITSIKASQDKFEHLAHHDPLTNLPNRLLLNARLGHALKRAKRKDDAIGVIVIDLDNFKSINDSLGHPLGDHVLHMMSQRLIGHVRKDDTVARYGGDEFVIILESSDATDTSLVAEKILSSLETPFFIDELKLFITASMGISLYPEDGSDITTLLKNADAAMYKSKESGKNRYSFYTSDLTKAATEHLKLGNALRSALSGREFEIYYQPQYSLSTDKLIGAEALLRWDHPAYGTISPSRFIPIAESNGMILPIGAWVLRTACTQLMEWRRQGFSIDQISVNISGKQFQQMDMVQVVQAALDSTGLEPQALELEVTETFIMRQADNAIATLQKLKDMGVKLAIDDFGTGYSSMSYLNRLPIHKLKIDKSFIENIPRDSDEVICKAIIALGKSLQLKVIAEGVETQEQKAFLISAGCDEIQGFIYSPPLSTKDFSNLLRR